MLCLLMCDRHLSLLHQAGRFVTLRQWFPTSQTAVRDSLEGGMRLGLLFFFTKNIFTDLYCIVLIGFC